jgi:nucleoside-diphosphate kinase
MAEVQKTLVLLKPDALQRDLLGEIIRRFELKGLKIVALKFIRLSDEMLTEHYAHLAEKPFFASLKSFMMQTPVVGMVLEGIDGVEAVRKIVGATNPRAADAGTIRADFAMNVPSNLIHASDSAESAAAEVKRFFGDDEIFSYEKITDRFQFGEGI